MRLQDLTAIVRGLAPVLRDHMALLQAKDRGLDGAPGPAGPEGKPGRDGLPGQPGRDGARGERGSDGTNGVNGRDGTMTLDDLELLQLDERTIVLRNATTGKQLGREIRLYQILDRGVFVLGTAYQKGDGVSYGHSFWIAQRDTVNEAPIDGGHNDAWRLAIKRPRDGAKGDRGPQGERGVAGRPGDPGRNFS